ncbi:MAG: NAD(P)-dependent oxidoreductase [Thermomonas sp.]|jgi:dTDP-6-deoxy-L-talose 4-dehydrogenase (NAD+)|uniref:NAD-dependent epimerase/dehydratase family protein n=1 Tax=Thermomonas sp. TaxID=1971895 RepID=UPI001EC8067B|nr:NAD(P)-dependent oxidoreductase [Thermomonas sp.]MBK6333591.1 NAD(P)-dependent oxidoreductase [Thermomonas sp.]MBK6416216.1 NAD(P)-dependent oxidoreductase [Thermomonas sp.]MBK7205273.1 NAD(P)-dependent oxidoreductase [Thermomonas sp.]
MRIAITGASGFIGCHVVRELAARGIEITVARFGRPIPGLPLSAREVPLDIHSPAADPFAELGRPDILLHLAWSGLPHYGSPHHLESELPAQLAFLSACVRSGIRRVVATGTCFEYGLALGEIEESQPLRPVTRYGDAKARLFEGMSLLRESVPFEFAWPRLFYLFGPGQSANSVYSQLHAAIERNDATFAMSGGEQVRDYLPAAEAATLLVDVAIHAGDAGAINLCSGIPVKLVDQVARWIAESGSSIRMELGRLPYPEFEPMAFWGSRRKLDQVLGGT